MVKRIVEIILGVIITVFLLGSYGDEHTPQKSLISYITTNGILQIIIAIGLVVLASRLIAGRPKDYSKTVYSILVKLFGRPKSEDR